MRTALPPTQEERDQLINAFVDLSSLRRDFRQTRHSLRAAGAVGKRSPRNILQVIATLKSDNKKFKDRAFAAGVDREEVRHAVGLLGEDLGEHTQFVIEAMRGIAPELGLAGAE